MCSGPTHKGHRGGGDEGTVVLAPLGMGRPAAWLSAQYHAQSPPSRKKGQTHNTQTGLLPNARALSRVSLTPSLTEVLTLHVCVRSFAVFSVLWLSG